MEKIKQLDFTSPLTKRGFLLFKAGNRIEPEMLTGDTDLTYPLIVISSILFLYGGNITSLHSGLSAFMKKKLMVRENAPNPHIFFRYKDKPLYKRDGEYGLSKKVLEEGNYNFWYPFQWMDKEGDEIRLKYERLENTKSVLKSYTTWEEKNKKLQKLVLDWQKSFLKEYKKHKDLQFEFNTYKNHFSLSVSKNSYAKDIKGMKIQNQDKMDYFQDFAKFIFTGFLNKSKEFPKCIYE